MSNQQLLQHQRPLLAQRAHTAHDIAIRRVSWRCEVNKNHEALNRNAGEQQNAEMGKRLLGEVVVKDGKAAWQLIKVEG
jgi:hypothetical protein